MVEQHEIDYLLTVSVEPSRREIQKIETSVYRILEFVKRASGSEDFATYIAQGQQLISMTRSAIMAIHALEIASGPLGWIYAGTSLLATGLMWADTLSSMEARR